MEEVAMLSPPGAFNCACTTRPKLKWNKSDLMMENRSVDSAAEQALDPSFVSLDPKNYRKYFKKGKVFRTLWPEPANSSENQRNGAINMEGWGEQMIVKIHWFVVVQTWSGHCLVVPVHTYDGRGATKSGINADDHCALVAKGQPQVTLDGEQLRRPPLHLILENPNIDLKTSSRINFAKFHTVEYNIKISTVGRIAPEDISTMGMYWRQSITKAPVETPPSSIGTRSSNSVNNFNPKGLDGSQEWRRSPLPDNQPSGEWISACREAENRRENILNWLSTTHLIVERQPEMGEWLLACPEYQIWLESTGGTLFCPGLPGVGKTMTTSIVVNHLRGQFQEDPTVGICYVRCEEDFRGKNKIPHLIFLLVKQLIQRHQEFFNLVAEIKSRFEIKQRQPKQKDLLDILRTLIAGLARTFIVIDAVDELEGPSDSRQNLVKEILNIQSGRRINLFVTSRFTPYVTRMFRDSPTKEIHGEQNINYYLDRSISRLPESVKRSPKFQQDIRLQIEQASNGNLSLATSLLDLCTEMVSVEDIQNSLKFEEIPFSALHTAWYDRVHRIVVEPRGCRELARRALMWTAFARWPLTAVELQHALAIDIDKYVLRKESIPSLEAILSACAGFLCIESGTGTVNLVHESAKSFLLQSQWFPDAHEIIAKTCSTYLLLDDFANGCSESDKELQTKFQNFPLYVYASWNWGHHAQLASVTQYTERVVQRFAESPTHVQAWHQVIVGYLSGSAQDNMTKARPGNVHVLHIAASLDLNLDNFISLLLDPTKLSIDVDDGQGRTPLSYAAERGSQRAVEKLVTHGANSKARDRNGRTPLWWALRYQHDTVVRFLLQESASCESLGSVNQLPAVAFASQWGLLSSVQELLKAGVDSDERDGRYQRTALMWAATNGHTNVVRALLEKKNVDRNVKDSSGRTALALASWMGFESIVRLLLGVDCETEDEGERPPRYEAKQGQNAIDVEAIDNIQHRSALSLAAEGGFLGIVQLLLRQGANPQSQSIVNQTPLFFAVDNGHIDIVESLLQNGADPCHRDTFNQTPQDRASLRGENLIHYRLGITEKPGVDQQFEKFGNKASNSSVLIASKSYAMQRQFFWESDASLTGRAKKLGFIFGRFTRSVPFLSLDESLKSRSQNLLLRAQGVKQTIIRFLFHYDDNELHDEIHISWRPDHMFAGRQGTSDRDSGQHDTTIDTGKKSVPESDDHHISVVVTKAAVDEDEILGMKSKHGGKAHSATYSTGTNLFNEVIDILLDSIQAAPPGNHKRIKFLIDIGMIHIALYEETKSLPNLEEAISRTRQALSELEQNQSDLQLRYGEDPVHHRNLRVLILANLGIQLEHLYRRTAHFTVLDEAIRSMRHAINASSRNIQRFRLIHILGVQLQDRYAKTGDRMDLEEAIDLTQEVVDSMSPGASFTRNRVAMLSNFASLLADRFAETGHGDDGERARQSMEKAIEIMNEAPDGVINAHARAALWNNLGSVCTELFLQNGHLDTLDNAIHHARKASEITPNNCTERAVVLSHYAMLLCMGNEWLPKKYNNLHDAVDDAQKATTLAQARPDSVSGAAVLYNLGSAHLYRFLICRESKDLDKAVSSIEEAIDGALKVHTDLRVIYNHSRIRFGSKHSTISVLRCTAGIFSRPRWYLKVSDQTPTESGTSRHFGTGPSDGNRSLKKNESIETVSQEVIQAASAYVENGEEILKRLLHEWGSRVVTEKALKAAAGNVENGDKVLKLLLDACRDTISVTEEVLEAAAGNWEKGDKVMALLFQHRSDKIVITDAIIRAAIKNETTGNRILALLIQKSLRGLKRKRDAFDGQLGQDQSPVTLPPAHRSFSPRK